MVSGIPLMIEFWAPKKGLALKDAISVGTWSERLRPEQVCTSESPGSVLWFQF